MKTGVRLGLVIAAAYLVSLLFTVPAAQMYAALRNKLPTLALYGVTGSVWSGTADLVQYQNLALHNLHWTVSPWPLLMGRLEMHLRLEDRALRADGRLGQTLGGDAYAEELNGELPLSALQGLLPLPLRVDGHARLGNVSLRYADGKLSSASGQVDLTGISTPAPVLTLGGFRLEFVTTAHGIKANLSDVDSPLALQGTALLKPDGRYRFTGTLAARRDAPPTLGQYLKLLGPTGPDGKVKIDTSGQLFYPT